MMLLRSTFSRNAPRALQNQFGLRGMASAATPGLQYDVSESAGVKVANREVPSPTGSLVLVAKAGPRYQPLPGLTEALDSFAFKLHVTGIYKKLTRLRNWQSTLSRSALRITREVELLGGEIGSIHSRENLILKTKFLSSDLPYFAELLAEVASQTMFQEHELNEHVIHHLKLKQQALSANPQALADDIAHGLAFHRGLGENITPNAAVPIEKYLSTDAVAEFAKHAFAKPNIALASSGPTSGELSRWVGEFFKGLPSSGGSNAHNLQPHVASKYFGGEQRVASKAGNAVVIGFQGSSAFGTSGFKPEASVLAALLGGESTIKWTPGFSLLAQATQGFSQLHVSTKNHAYSDAGLFTVELSGKADQVAAGSKNVVNALQKVAAGEVSSEDIKKASALAKFRALESLQNVGSGLEATGSALVHGGKPYDVGQVAEAIDKVTEQQVKDAAKSTLSGKASFAAVGDLFQLPFATDLGLTV